MIQRRSLAGAIALIGLAGSTRGFVAAAQPVDARFSIYVGPATRWPGPEEYVAAPNILNDLTAMAVGEDADEINLIRSWIPEMTTGEERSVRLLSSFNHNGTPGVMRVRRVK